MPGLGEPVPGSRPRSRSNPAPSFTFLKSPTGSINTNQSIRRSSRRTGLRSAIPCGIMWGLSAAKGD